MAIQVQLRFREQQNAKTTVFHDNNRQTFAPARLVGSRSIEEAVSAEVTFAIKMAMMMRPNRIHMTEKMRATIDFGDLSPYLICEDYILV